VRVALLLALVAGLYAPLGGAPFIYEDAQTRQAATQPRDWVPPTRVLALETLRPSLVSPQTAHLGNLLLHLANTTLVASLGGGWVGLVAAGVFALHPVNVQAVAYVSGRADLLVTLGLLVACVGAWRRSVWLAVLGVVIGAWSKEIGLMVAPIALWTWACIHGLSRRSWSGLVLVAVVSVIALWPALYAMATVNPQGGGSPITGLPGAWLQLGAVASILASVITLEGFTIDRDPWVLRDGWRVLGAGLLTGALVTLLHPRVSTSVRWGIGVVLFVLGPRLIVQTWTGPQEHHLYAAMGPISLGLGAAITRLCALETTWPLCATTR